MRIKNKTFLLNEKRMNRERWDLKGKGDYWFTMTFIVVLLESSVRTKNVTGIWLGEDRKGSYTRTCFYHPNAVLIHRRIFPGFAITLLYICSFWDTSSWWGYQLLHFIHLFFIYICTFINVYIYIAVHPLNLLYIHRHVYCASLRNGSN